MADVYLAKDLILGRGRSGSEGPEDQLLRRRGEIRLLWRVSQRGLETMAIWTILISFGLQISGEEEGQQYLAMGT